MVGDYNEKTKYFIQYKGKEGKGFQKMEFTSSQITEGNYTIGKSGINYPEEWECIVSNRRESDTSITFFFTIGVKKCPLE